MQLVMKLFCIFLLVIFSAARSSYSGLSPGVISASARPQSETAPGNLVRLASTLGKTYYISQDSAYYEAAQTNCKNTVRGTLASIETRQEKNEIRKKLQGIAADRIWVGGMIDSTPLCASYTEFHKECWIWDQSGELIDEAVIPWNTGMDNKPQTRLHRTVLDTGALALNIEQNTLPFIYLCETS